MHLRTHRAMYALAAVLALAGVPRIARGGLPGGTFTWNTGNGTYSVITNWTPGAPVGGPGATDTAQFTQATTPTVSFTSSPSSAVLQVTGGTVSFSASGAARTYTINSLATVQGATLDLPTGASAFTLSVPTLTVQLGGTLEVDTTNTVSATSFAVSNSGVGGGQIAVSGGTFNCSGPGTIGINGSLGTLHFENSASGSLAMLNLAATNVANSSATLTVDTGATVTAAGSLSFGTGGQAGQHTNVTVTGTGSTFTQTGNNTLFLGGTANSISTLTVDEGGIFSTGTGNITIEPTGTLHLQKGLNFGTFNANGNMHVVAGGSIGIDGGPNEWVGTLDLHGHKLAYDTTVATKAAILTRLQNQVTYGATHSAGITSSSLPANTTVAVIDNGSLTTPFTTFGGFNVDGNSILVAPELSGDANADGVVNFADFVVLSNHYGASGVGWAGADFNGDGVTNFADFVQISNHYGQTFGSPSIVVGADDVAAFEAASAAFFAGAVPEPGTGLLAGLGVALAVARRRRGAPG